MAGKNAYFRLIIIDKQLQTGRKLNWKQLAEVCENANSVRSRPSERTIREDIKTLRKQHGAPIPLRCPDSLWYYTDTSFSINNNPLFIRDVILLTEVKDVLDQFPELNFSQSLESIIQKIQANLSYQANPIPRIIQFEKNKNVVQPKYLQRLYQDILSQNTIELTYQPFTESQPKIIIVHPYFLKQYNSRWFLVGLETATEKLRLYGLERIQKIKSTTIPFQNNDQINPDSYFDNVIGVSIPDDVNVQTIRLKVTPQRTPYILTKKIHPSQKVIKTLKSGFTIIEIQVIPNFELKALLLSHGLGIKVISPQSLKSSLQLEVEKMHKQYL